MQTRPATGQPALLLVKSEDLHPESWVMDDIPISALTMAADGNLMCGDRARAFIAAAAEDSAQRAATHFACPADVVSGLDSVTLLAASRAANVRQIVAGHAPVGLTAQKLALATAQLSSQGICLHQVCRGWDEEFWPHAKKGFFPFKNKIQTLLQQDGLA